MDRRINNKQIMSNHWIYWLVWLALLAGTGVSLAFGARFRLTSDDRREQRRIDESTRDSEIAFMKRLMDFEASAVAIARAGEDKSRHAEMRNYLDGVERRGVRRIERMRDWLGQWYGAAYTPVSNLSLDRRLSPLRRPEMRGNEFEIGLLKTTIDHHLEERAMIERYLPLLAHSDLQALAREVFDKRDDDTRQLQTWLRSWYDVRYSGESGATSQPPQRMRN